VALALVFAGIVWVLPRTNVAPMALQLCIYSAGLFVSCMVCHGEVYRLRPEPRHLTAFYLAISVGGALGGVFVALIAPLIFSDYFELHWGLALCGGLLFALWLRPGASRPAWWLRPAWACMAAGLLCFGAALWHHENASRASRVARSRNFYGVLTLLKEEPKSSALGHLKLMHGTILHGVQLVGPSVAATPTAYYSEDSGIGLAFKALPPNSRRVGLVGLGVGTVAAYAREGDYFRFYEINPEVARLAAATFTFLTNCQGRADVVLGDGRLSLEKEPAQEFDLMVLDAFSSDAIPVHLLTSEAFDVYERHIKTNGIIAVHLSNRHLELEPVLAELASRRCLQAVVIDHAAQGDKWWVGPSAWMLLSRRDGFPALLRDSARPARPGSKKLSPWTDDFASLYHVLRWKAVPQMGPGPAQKEMALAFSLSEKGDMPGAIACYSRALELDPTSPSALNNAAWLLATSAEPGLRNGAEAVRLAEKACRLTNHGHTMLVGTLAAAYAEAGRFAEAISTAQKACALASQSGDQALLARNTELLELYRLGKPYFEPHARGQK
jgi:tetratricopeptide (TPR) repeat protein